MPVSAAKRKVSVSVHIRPIAQLAPENGLQSGFKVEGKITIPTMCARIAGGGIHERKPEDFSLLDIDAKLRPELAACALTRHGNSP
jgi:hypothetical protein